MVFKVVLLLSGKWYLDARDAPQFCFSGPLQDESAPEQQLPVQDEEFHGLYVSAAQGQAGFL